MNNDLKNMTLPDLIKLQRDVQDAIETFTERAKRDAIAKLEECAKELGFSLASLLGVYAPKAKKPVIAKFAHPDDPTITWSGRGRKPAWFSQAVASGNTTESLSA
jgi:DNA-binding protein H-NS